MIMFIVKDDVLVARNVRGQETIGYSTQVSMYSMVMRL